MHNDNVIALAKPEPKDALQEVLKQGAQQLLMQAVEAELQTLLNEHRSLTTEYGKKGLARNGYLPEHTV